MISSFLKAYINSKTDIHCIEDFKNTCEEELKNKKEVQTVSVRIWSQ